jgi:hypothetical protein
MNKYTEAIQGDDVVILCDGIPMGVGEILAALNAAPPPADAALADVTEMIIRDVCESDIASPDHPDTICIAVDDLTEIVSRHVAALRARPQAVAEGYALVPAEPTEAMLSVAVDNWSGYEEESGRFYTPLDSDIRILWNVMLAASQSADVKAGG